MIFNNENINKSILKEWRYYGKCKDKKGDIWTFYTNSGLQFNDFKKKRKIFDMEFIEGHKNKNYDVIRRLIS